MPAEVLSPADYVKEWELNEVGETNKVPRLGALLHPFFLVGGPCALYWEKSWYPYSNLSIAGPSQAEAKYGVSCVCPEARYW